MTHLPRTAKSQEHAIPPGIDSYNAMEPDDSLLELQQHVTCAWRFLQQTPAGAADLFLQALERLHPLLGCCVSCRPLSAGELNADLSKALANYHPEEIKVVAYALFANLVDLVRAGRRRRGGGFPLPQRRAAHQAGGQPGRHRVADRAPGHHDPRRRAGGRVPHRSDQKVRPRST